MIKSRILCNGCGREFAQTAAGLPHRHGSVDRASCRWPTHENQRIVHPVHRPSFPRGRRVRAWQLRRARVAAFEPETAPDQSADVARILGIDPRTTETTEI